MISWASVVGSGIAGALIAYPLMYYALSNRYRARLSNVTNLCLFIVTVPLIGIAVVAFGGDSQSLSGFLVLFGAPLLVCFMVIGLAFESRAERARTQPGAKGVGAVVKGHLRRFTRSAERLALVALLLGLVILLSGLIGYWSHRGFYWSELKYDLREIFLDDIRYGRGWTQWFARIGLPLSVLGYAVSYHYDRTVTPVVGWVSRFARWIRTGE